ncbi:MAG TPA: glycosyltransferase 87 family protein, partial [Thermoleophilaceae bacterium]|nr:glycosyltransferase 87 family protein [Thermoleophilaceae bacterium]
LAVGLVLLVGFRITLNAVDSHVMDVGSASAIGADRIDHGEDLYSVRPGGDDHLDTYGPVTYLAYLPFEAIWPADGEGGATRAAKAAAVTFDVLIVGALLLLGARLRRGREGRALGLALAYAWAAYPFSLYALQANTNDGLVALLLVLALVAVSSPLGRGALVGLAGAAKFAPLVLAPLLATGRDDEPRRRAWPLFAAGLGSVLALSVFAYLPDGGLREFYDATIGYQLGRQSPFSIWGLHPSLSWLQSSVKVGGALLAVVVAFVPSHRDTRQVAALAGAVLIAAQLAVDHWFYFYIVWFAPLALAAMFGAYRLGATTSSVPSRRRDVVPAAASQTPTLAGSPASTSKRAGVSGSA